MTFNAAFDQLKREISHIVLILHQQPIKINFVVLEPKDHYTIGFHSNPQLQLEAYQLYDDHFVAQGLYGVLYEGNKS